MATLTQRFTRRVARGFQSMVGYSTSIGSVPSGHEKRNENMANALTRWVATEANKQEEETQELRDYFHACAGRANNFPFQDWTDYRVETGQGTLVSLGGNLYQLYKSVTVGAVTRTRKIVRPYDVTVDGGGTYSVSGTTGVLTHSGGAAPTGWAGRFDLLCRFDTDELPISVITTAGSGNFIYTWGGLSFREDRL